MAVSDPTSKANAPWSPAWGPASAEVATPDAPPMRPWKPGPAFGQRTETSSVRPMVGTGRSSQVVLKGRTLYFRATVYGLLVASIAGLGVGALLVGKDQADLVVGVFLVAIACPLTAWIVYRCLTMRVTVDGTALLVRNMTSSRNIPWSAVEDISTRLCRGGEGGSFWTVVIARRDTGKKVPISALVFSSWLGTASSGAQDRAEASVARLKSLAPPGFLSYKAASDAGDKKARKSIWRSSLIPIISLALVALAAVPIILVRGTSSSKDPLPAYLNGTSGPAFFASDAHFSALFPIAPTRHVQTTTVDGRGLAAGTYASAFSNRGFVVGFFTRVSGALLDLDATAKDLVVDGTVISLKHATFKGYDAVDLVMTTTTPQGYGEAMVFATPTNSYALVVYGPESPPKGYNRFIQSFQVAG